MNQKPKLLVIDDEEVVRDSCTQVLAGGDFQIVTAPDGTQGLQLVKEFMPDLVFVDLKMPGISGLEVLDEIHNLDPNIVTVVITGYATVSSAVEAMKKGAYDFLPKPFTPDELRLIARRSLERRKLILETIALRKEKEMLREQFAAIVSHELKAPLGALQQNLYVLVDELSDQLSEEQKRRFERMKVGVGDLINLILTWLRVLSVDVNKIQENFIPTSIATVAAKAVETIQPHATRKDVEIVSTIAEPLSQVNGDEGTLVETLVNLLNNAVKYSRGGSQILLKAEESESDILISVIDQGMGIAQNDLPHIFNDFYSGKPGQSAEKGSGIGLAITRRIVEAHRGTITVESEVGKGSVFMIRLPALKIPEHA